MVFEDSGVTLRPGNGGKDCPGNGAHRDEKSKLIECRCDECDYMLLCFHFDGSPCTGGENGV